MGIINRREGDRHERRAGRFVYDIVQRHSDVHIDANRLGWLGIELGAALKTQGAGDSAVVLKKFTQEIESIAKNATQRAVAPIMETIDRSVENYKYPFRPLVFAGDDLTIILRAADALGFVERYLTVFEEEGTIKLSEFPFLKKPELTAAAGIAYVKSNYPFALGYQLCESLCGYAKKKTDRKASALAFHRVTASRSGEGYEEIVKRELSANGARN